MDALRGYGALGLGSRLKRVSEYMMREGQLVYDTYHIDFDPYLFPVFKTISHHNGITNTELVEQLNFTQPAITQFVNKLHKKGYVELQPHPSDKRKKVIRLTKKGAAMLIAIKPLWQAIEKTISGLTNYQSASLLDQINHLENQFKDTPFSTMIMEHIGTDIDREIIIVDYDTQYNPQFYDLNIEWLNTFFYVEAYDEEVLSKPDIYIINKGGYIFFAVKNNKVVGTVALMPTPIQGVLELTKMAVLPEERGQKIGQRLLQHCIDFAKTKALKALMLYSNTKLENAIYLYRKYGFKELALELDSPYERANIKMQLDL